jgi:Protein of unknown function (DUF3800)
MDESGNTGTKIDAAQPIHLIGCLIVEDVAVRPFEDALAKIAEAHFPQKSKDPTFEFHGAEIFQGSGIFRGVKPADRIAAVHAIVDAVNEHVASFGYAGVDKLKSFANDHPHRIAFTLLVEQLQTWLKQRKALGLIIADENKEISQKLIDDFALFKEFATNWGYRRIPVTNIIDSVHFVQSHNNRIMQACDVVTYMFMKARNLRANKRAHHKALVGKSWTQPEHIAWLRENQSDSEKATLEIAEKINQLQIFRAKIWPNRG